MPQAPGRPPAEPPPPHGPPRRPEGEPAAAREPAEATLRGLRGCQAGRGPESSTGRLSAPPRQAAAPSPSSGAAAWSPACPLSHRPRRRAYPKSPRLESAGRSCTRAAQTAALQPLPCAERGAAERPARGAAGGGQRPRRRSPAQPGQTHPLPPAPPPPARPRPRSEGCGGIGSARKPGRSARNREGSGPERRSAHSP